jgi:hypothetical protein
VLSSPANQEGLGGDVTVGSLPLELGKSWGSACLAWLLWQPSLPAGRSWRKVPLTCVEDFSVKCALGKWSRDIGSTWVTGAHQEWGFPFFTARQSYHATRFFRVHRHLCLLGLNLIKQNMPPWKSLLYRLHWFQGFTVNTRSHGVLLVDWQGRKEFTWKPRHLFTWHQFSTLHGTLHHGNVWLKKSPQFTSVS